MLPEEKKWPQALSSCNPSRHGWKTREPSPTGRCSANIAFYCDGKLFGCVCDDRLFVKITEPGKAFMPDGQAGMPYEGGKPMLRVERLEDRAFLKKLVRMTCEALPEPKKKR